MGLVLTVVVALGLVLALLDELLRLADIDMVLDEVHRVGFIAVLAADIHRHAEFRVVISLSDLQSLPATNALSLVLLDVRVEQGEPSSHGLARE